MSNSSMNIEAVWEFGFFFPEKFNVVFFFFKLGKLFISVYAMIDFFITAIAIFK